LIDPGTDTQKLHTNTHNESKILQWMLIKLLTMSNEYCVI